MHGLTVRWSLADATEGVEEGLEAYVETSSHPRFTGRSGLRFKTWRMRRGEWFEGCYVFESSAERDSFQQEFTQIAPGSPVSQIVGHGPELIEPCEVVAVAEGGARFLAAPRYR
jgi:hypothetical protein